MRDVLERFMAKVIKTPGGHHLWMGAVGGQRGYGQIRVDGRAIYAHRWIWEHMRGPIPEGYQIDHLCRITTCVNPDHLEPVTQRENIRRSESLSAQNARKTHCKRGHLLEGDNLYQFPSQPGGRECRRCALGRSAARKKALREGLAPSNADAERESQDAAEPPKDAEETEMAEVITTLLRCHLCGSRAFRSRWDERDPLICLNCGAVLGAGVAS